MLVMAENDMLGADLLGPRVLRAAPRQEEAETELFAGLEGTLKDRVEALEARILRETLIRHRWNKSRAASILGIERSTLDRKIRRYALAEQK